MRPSAQPIPHARAPEGRRERTCAGCRLGDSPDRLIRVVLGPDGEVVPDLARKAYGRGAWVHPAPQCLSKAAPRGFSRSFRCTVQTPPTEFWQSLRDAAERRAEGLLSAALRSGRAAVGSTRAKEAFEQSRAHLVLVTTDARAAAEAAWVREAVRSGIVLGWGSKHAFGRATRRDDVAIIAVLDDRIAKALSFTVGVAQLPAPVPGTREVQMDRPTEDG